MIVPPPRRWRTLLIRHLNGEAICCETNSWTMANAIPYIFTCLVSVVQDSASDLFVVISQPACQWWCGTVWIVNSECNRVWRKSTKRKFNRIYLLFFRTTSNVDRVNHYIPVSVIDRIPYLFIASFFFSSLIFSFSVWVLSVSTFVDRARVRLKTKKKVKT